MTIQEAIQTGRPFKRPEHDFYLVVFQGWFYTYKRNPWTFMVEILLGSTRSVEKAKKRGRVKLRWAVPEYLHRPTFIPKITILTAESVLADDWETLDGGRPTKKYREVMSGLWEMSRWIKKKETHP